MTPTLPSRIKFFYIKNPAFRVIHVDGALGGITPRGLIHVGLYSERPAIPQMVEQQLLPDGVLGAESSREGKQGIVREIDADLMMSKQTATELRDWLNDRIAELEKIQAKSGDAPRSSARKAPRRVRRED